MEKLNLIKGAVFALVAIVALFFATHWLLGYMVAKYRVPASTPMQAPVAFAGPSAPQLAQLPPFRRILIEAVALATAADGPLVELEVSEVAQCPDGALTREAARRAQPVWGTDFQLKSSATWCLDVAPGWAPQFQSYGDQWEDLEGYVEVNTASRYLSVALLNGARVAVKGYAVVHCPETEADCGATVSVELSTDDNRILGILPISKKKQPALVLTREGPAPGFSRFALPEAVDEEPQARGCQEPVVSAAGCNPRESKPDLVGDAWTVVPTE